MNIAPYRKAFVAVIAAAVTVAQAFGVPVAEDLSTELVAVFDAFAALLVYAIPNAD